MQQQKCRPACAFKQSGQHLSYSLTAKDNISNCYMQNSLPFVTGNLYNTPGRQQSKTPILSKSVDKKSIEIVFSIAICRQWGDKWQLKTLFLSIFNPRSLIDVYIFDCHLSGVYKSTFANSEEPNEMLQYSAFHQDLHCLLR